MHSVLRDMLFLQRGLCGKWGALLSCEKPHIGPHFALLCVESGASWKQKYSTPILNKQFKRKVFRQLKACNTIHMWAFSIPQQCLYCDTCRETGRQAAFSGALSCALLYWKDPEGLQKPSSHAVYLLLPNMVSWSLLLLLLLLLLMLS